MKNNMIDTHITIDTNASTNGMEWQEHKCSGKHENICVCTLTFTQQHLGTVC